MKTVCFFPLAVSYFWLSDICQGCRDWVLDTSGEMVKSCFQQRAEQGNSWEHVCVVWSDQSLPTSDRQQTALTRLCCRGLGHTVNLQKSVQVPQQSTPINHSPSTLNSQEPALGFGLVPGAPGLFSGSRLTLDTGGWTATLGPSKGYSVGSSQGQGLPCLTP